MIDQVRMLAQLTPQETRLLFQTVMIEYDQSFSIVQVNRKANGVEVTINLQKGGRKVVRI